MCYSNYRQANNAGNKQMTINETILDLFRACGAQEFYQIYDECRTQFDSALTVRDVNLALDRLIGIRKISKMTEDGLTVWGLPSDF